LAVLVVERAAVAKQPQSPCGKPPDLVAKGVLPKEEQQRAKNIRAQGSVAITISEDGEVVAGRVLRATSAEAGKILVDLVKGMKFKPRPGCGPFKTTMNFSLAE
jgi:hypothetical protein